MIKAAYSPAPNRLFPWAGGDSCSVIGEAARRNRCEALISRPSYSPAGPAGVSSRLRDGLRSEAMAQLRHAIAKIERPQALPLSACDRPDLFSWRLGCPEIDRLLPQGLDACSVHEVKAQNLLPRLAKGASAADWMTALGFALRLGVRRLQGLPQEASGWFMWCWSHHLARELGSPSALGLAQLGIDPARLILIETARPSEALIALEDTLRSSSVALALGIFDDVALTPSRRLSLAASAHRTPCLLVTHPQTAPASSAATRWRIGRVRSAPHPLLPRLPGALRFEAVLERCRARPASSAHPPLILEWSDETRAFSLAADVAHRSVAPRHACGGAF